MFKDRSEAGKLLAEALARLSLNHPYLLAVPRGGIVIAQPIAQKLKSNIQMLVTRKIGHPLNPEVAIGVVMPDGSAVWNPQVITHIGISQPDFEKIIADL